MATKYSDIITLRESKPAYNIKNEEKNEWNTFIANDQFNEILKRVIKSVRNDDADQHKSFWISGTYGTGKSHAGAAIKHLLCDPFEDIEEYIKSEYTANKYTTLRDDLLVLRRQKRLFPVALYGQQSIAHEKDLSLQLQVAIKSALKNAGFEDIIVRTEFDNYIDHIQSHSDFWDVIIKSDDLLSSLAPTSQKLIQDLKKEDAGILNAITNALRANDASLLLDNKFISQWIFEIQNELVLKGEYNGLFIIWDEFTDVMTSPIGLRLLVILQEIAEIAMRTENNSYFLFISHPSAFNSLKEEEREKTKGRYHYMSYNMEPVSAFKIMSRKFKPVNSEDEYSDLSEQFYSKHSKLLSIFSASSANSEETKCDIRHLFPLHPSTANLATYYAREAGASSRSVFEFLGANNAIKEFIDNEKHFANGDTITADYLWDYVLEAFNANVSRFGAVTERFNSYKLQVKDEGEEYFAVFKSILLLNALNNVANNETVTPSEENIRNLFIGTSIEKSIDCILRFFNKRSIIQRAPGGIFSIQFSTLPIKEIEEIKQHLASTQFKFTSQVVNSDETVNDEIKQLLANVARENRFMLYSKDVNKYTLLSKIENGYKQVHSYEIFMALFFSRSNDELQYIKEIVSKASLEERFCHVVFIVFEAIFDYNKYEYDRFIEYQAHALCAQNHGLTDQKEIHLKYANDMIKEWMRRIRQNNFVYYLRNKQGRDLTMRIANIINADVSPTIFSSGPESLKLIRDRFSKTHWKKASVKSTVFNIISFNTKEDINKHCKRSAQHVIFLLQDSVDENLEWKPDIDKTHPLYQVCEFVEKKLRCTNKNLKFNLAEKLEDLSRPPFGLYQSYAGMGMLAFSMKKYVKQIFDLNGKPREAEHIVEDVIELFKSWEEKKKSDELDFMFETQETQELCSNFIQVFQLNKLKEYNDVSSLTDACWAITHEYLKKKEYPLWSLKYTYESEQDTITESQLDGIKTLIDNILKVCEVVKERSSNLISSTLNGFETYKFEFISLLNRENSFKSGFVNYLRSVDSVKLQDNEVNEALKYIFKHLQKTIGLWSEQEVTDALKDWKIKQIPVSATKALSNYSLISTIKTTLTSTSSEDEVALGNFNNIDKLKCAKEKIDQIQSIDNAKHLLEKICDCGYEDILDLINDYA